MVVMLQTTEGTFAKLEKKIGIVDAALRNSSTGTGSSLGKSSPTTWESGGSLYNFLSFNFL